VKEDKLIEKCLLTDEEIGNLEWDSTDLEMYYYEQFAESHPKEAKAVNEAQVLKAIPIIREKIGEKLLLMLKHNPIKSMGLRSELGKYAKALKEESNEL